MQGHNMLYIPNQPKKDNFAVKLKRERERERERTHTTFLRHEIQSKKQQNKQKNRTETDTLRDISHKATFFRRHLCQDMT